MSSIIDSDNYPEMFKLGNQWSQWYTIGFAAIDRLETNTIVAGSGTLVCANENYAILTADHVVKYLRKLCDKDYKIGLILFSSEKTQLHRIELPLNHTKLVTVGKASNTSDGPDLAYILLLSRNDVNMLKAKRNFYNLGKNKDKIMPSIETPGWSISGVVDEWTQEEKSTHQYTRVKLFTGLYGIGVLKKYSEQDNYDYVEFETRIDNTYTGPQNYQGMSGGGLWHISYKQEKGQLEIYEGLLGGVVFYQSGFINGVNTIYCHGHKSIYHNLYSNLINE